MANVKLNWKLPTTRVDGSAVTAADVRQVRIEISADQGTNWSAFDAFPSNVLETTITDLEPGEWRFRGFADDYNGLSSAAKETSCVIPAPVVALSPLTELTAILA